MRRGRTGFWLLTPCWPGVRVMAVDMMKSWVTFDIFSSLAWSSHRACPSPLPSDPDPFENLQAPETIHDVIQPFTTVHFLTSVSDMEGDRNWQLFIQKVSK